MVPSVPVTPEPAVSGPLTGGQKVAHWPEQFDLVEVSMANQYRVMPLESTTTCWLPMVFSVTVLPLAEAGAALLLLPPAAGVLAAVPELLLPELAQADTVRARAARPATPHIFRIELSPLHSARDLPLEITGGYPFQFTASSPGSADIERRQRCWPGWGRAARNRPRPGSPRRRGSACPSLCLPTWTRP